MHEFAHDTISLPKFDSSIKNTRWRIHDVWKDYISEAWDFTKATTCIREWDEEGFNVEFETDSDTFKPADAVRAALFVFFIANEEAVRARMPGPSENIDTPDIGSEPSPTILTPVDCLSQTPASSISHTPSNEQDMDPPEYDSFPELLQFLNSMDFENIQGVVIVNDTNMFEQPSVPESAQSERDEENWFNDDVNMSEPAFTLLEPAQPDMDKENKRGWFDDNINHLNQHNDRVEQNPSLIDIGLLAAMALAVMIYDYYIAIIVFSQSFRRNF